MVVPVLSKSSRSHTTCLIPSKLCPCLRPRSGLYWTKWLTTWCISYLFFSYSSIYFCLQEAMVTGIDDQDCCLATNLVSWPPSTMPPNESLQTTETMNGGCGLPLQATAVSCMTLYVFYLFLCKIDSLLCFSFFRIIFCPHGTQQTLCHCLSSCMILMHPHHCLWLSFLQVLLVQTSCFLTLVHLSPAFGECHQSWTKCLSLTDPSTTMCPALMKSPRSKLSNWPESFPTWFLWGQCIFLLFYLDF